MYIKERKVAATKPCWDLNTEHLCVGRPWIDGFCIPVADGLFTKALGGLVRIDLEQEGLVSVFSHFIF